MNKPDILTTAPGDEITPQTLVSLDSSFYTHNGFPRRITLTSYQPEDAAVIFSLIDRNRTFFDAFDEDWTEEYQSPQNVLDKIQDPANTSRFRFTIRNSLGNIVGAINLELSDKVAGAATIGYFIDQLETNRGYTSQALALLVHYASTTLNITTFVTEINPDDLGSIHTAKKVGFRHFYHDPKTGFDQYTLNRKV